MGGSPVGPIGGHGRATHVCACTHLLTCAAPMRRLSPCVQFGDQQAIVMWRVSGRDLGVGMGRASGREAQMLCDG